MKRAVFALVALTLLAVPLLSRERGAISLDARAVVEVDEGRRVLVIGAHPDDEDTQLISWLQRGGRAETAYLSITRGDGGQNLIGNELGEALGIIRTEELLAARRVDGAHQYFTRAYDFGFSKNAAETFAHWPKDSLLNDVVTVVRAFRPHIIVAIFSGTPRDGHGQHQVSAILAKEAYERASDTLRFPVSRFGPAWTALKLYRNARFSPQSATLRFNVGQYNPALGRSYAEIAGESRSQHKSQGFGALQRKGVIWDYLTREHSRVNAAADASKEQSMFDGLPEVAGNAMSNASDQRMSAAGVAVEAIADRQYVALGDSARVVVTLFNRHRSPVAVMPMGSATNGRDMVSVASDSAYRWTTWVQGTEVTQPWWLTTPRNGDLFSPKVGMLSEDEREKSSWLRVPVSADGIGHAELRAPVVYRYADPIRGDVQRPLAVAPAVSVALDRLVEIARANVPLDRFFNVTLRSALVRAAPVAVSLELPTGLRADSASRTLMLDSVGTRTVTFRVRGSLAPGTHTVSARATTGGATYATGFTPIDYEHITPERQYRPAQVAVRAIDVVVPSRLKVGYILGVSDNVAPALEQLGISVTMIDPRTLSTVDLSRFTTVVVGPRAYETSRELVYNNPYLLAFARNGGTLVVQYGQYEMMRPGIMPYPISINRPHDRVTEENAPVSILASVAATALVSPNRIGPRDFDGWVQERGLYMPRTFDSNYQTVLTTNDPGEPANQAGILIAPYGKGAYVYTTLAFFRQLPAGVSGGARLFVNLLSLNGKGMIAMPAAR